MREIRVSIGDADKRFCNECPNRKSEDGYDRFYYICPVFDKEQEDFGQPMKRCQACLDDEIKEPTEIVASSDEWHRIYKDLTRMKIIDPGGWDRKNLDESWNEKITYKEFMKRVMRSTQFHLRFTTKE